jgi:hypothetical protein
MKLPAGGREIGPTRLTVPCRLPGGGPLPGLAERCHPYSASRGRGHVKSAEEVMEILAAYDLAGSLRDAAQLGGRVYSPVMSEDHSADRAHLLVLVPADPGYREHRELG